ncbi:uncharacterized protein LOC134467619 [Engraulis encrasicolus]|uniref:uncharacterized protein LOC134467619 n=1 Tax=Engraulis encrasicolus TaxID=184585 RepID=UPI002FD3BDF2
MSNSVDTGQRERAPPPVDTPSVKELERIFWSTKRTGNHVDEVWPNLFIGNMSVANDRYAVWKLGITHVLNATHGKMHSQGSQEFYGSTIEYLGVPADDSPSFNLSRYFETSADYIHQALASPRAKVMVHCAVGVSRSASLVLAYLMIHHHLTLLEAVRQVTAGRWIFPNRGFLKQLRALDMRLRLRKQSIAQNKTALQNIGITHVLNAAHTKRGSIGDQGYYGSNFVYCGIPAEDSTHFDLDVYFRPAADFIHKALKTPDAKILVHCIMGLSRSSTLVLAYLMLYQRLPLNRALKRVIKKRAIYPNRNFLALLLDLDLQLNRKQRTCSRLRGSILKEKIHHCSSVASETLTPFCRLQHWQLVGTETVAAMPKSNVGRGGEGNGYETPSSSELQRLMWLKKGTSAHLDEVVPRIYIGDMYAAKDKRLLQGHNISHVLNAAHGKYNVNTGASYYRDTKIIYHGVEAFDCPSFDLSPFFYSAAKFIKSAMDISGKVLVHCAMGLSRSSTLVLAYLMIHENKTLPDAIREVAQNRNICPNQGFLEQLRQLDKELYTQRKLGSMASY